MDNEIDIYNATRIRDEKEGEYKPYVTKNFPEIDRPLPIVSQDFTYTMDIMFITTLDGENTEDIASREIIDLTKPQKKEKDFILKKKFDIRVARANDTEDMKPYSCALILIETTSRKTWGYPLRSKKSADVFEAFQQFLKDINNRIAKLLSDCGTEYSQIKKFNMQNELFHYFQANASQNRHTTLSRVDRVIRTLRGLIRDYYTTVEEGDWRLMLKHIINLYNNTKHNSLFLRDPDKANMKIFYTPEQVWSNPILRRRIKIKDYLSKYKNYRYMDTFFLPGTEVYYRITSKQLKYQNHKGYVSQYPAVIIQRIGNSFQIRLKNTDDKINDAREGTTKHYSGAVIIVPERDLILKKNVKKFRTKYNLKGMLNTLHNQTQKIKPEIEELSEDEEEEPPEIEDFSEPEAEPPEIEDFSEPEAEPPEIEDFSEPEPEPPEMENFSTPASPEVELVKVKEDPEFVPVKQEPIFDPALVKMEPEFNPQFIPQFCFVPVKMEPGLPPQFIPVKMEPGFDPGLVKIENPPKKKRKLTKADRDILLANWRIFAPQGSKRTHKPTKFFNQ